MGAALSSQTCIGHDIFVPDIRLDSLENQLYGDILSFIAP